MNALVLSGGGAFGAYEVGIIKALYEKSPFTAGVLTGTSVGAFNATVLAMDGGTSAAIRHLERIWLDEIAEIRPGRWNGVLRFRGDPLPWLRPGTFAMNPAVALTGLAREAMFYAAYAVRRGSAFLSSSQGLAGRSLELVDLSSFISV